jgi:hypothetical protein
VTRTPILATSPSIASISFVSPMHLSMLPFRPSLASIAVLLEMKKKKKKKKRNKKK